jgi:uncharacterized protein
MGPQNSESGINMLSDRLNEALVRNPRVAHFYELTQTIKPCDAAHDFSHMIRVARMTIDIYARETEANESRGIHAEEVDACIVAALLHDCVPVPKNSPLRKESSRLSSEKAREWLLECEWPTGWVDPICGAIRDHSYSAGHTPSTLLGESLQDADRLESLGAIGLYRTIATGVSMDCTLFDAADPWAKNRELDDRRFSVDHFFTKLFKLPASFCTKAAREEAVRRANFLQSFIDQLKHEIGS